MQRREFFRRGAGAAAAGCAAASLPAAVAGERPPGGEGPAVLRNYAAADHRRRLENIALGNRSIRACLRKHLVTNYLPGQCCYNLGEYPCRKPWNPDEWDERELDRLHDHGIRLVQVHEEWNDALRLFGADKYTPLNPAGFRRFVDMVHRRGMKLLVYVSSGYFQRTDPDFRPEWAHGPNLTQLYWDAAYCSPASPSWRAYLLPRLTRILDDYGVDGLYNDLGYRQPGNTPAPKTDEVAAFAESPTYDAALEDLLATIYAEVKRRGGIIKVHYDAARRPQTELKVYDYLWVGETCANGDALRDAVKNHPPYVVPCLDMGVARPANEDELYLNAIPYLQFPLLLAGRPFTGQRATIEGVKYQPEQDCYWMKHLLAIWRRYQAHPEGPHSYGWWDSSPGRPEARPTHAAWLARYLPLVEDGTWAWLDIGKSDLFAAPLPQGVVASAFANREFHLVLANYGTGPADVSLTDNFGLFGKKRQTAGRQWRLPPRSLQILHRVA